MKTEKELTDSSTCACDVTDRAEKKLRLLIGEGAAASMGLQWLNPELPAFFDKAKFELGQRTFYDNVFTMMIAKLAGLLSLMAVPTIVDVLIFTGQSATACRAFRRYVSTVLHAFVWYRKEPDTDNEFLQSLKIVRKKHCTAFKRSAEFGLKPVSQLDMAVTQFGFIGYTLLCGDFLGVNATDEEMEGLVHFWRVIGSMLGMEDKYNLCAGNLEETRALCKRLLEELFLPRLSKKNEKFYTNSKIVIEGLWPMVPQLDTDAFIAFTFRLAAYASTNNNHSIEIDTSSMTPYSRFRLSSHMFVHTHLLARDAWWAPFFRAYFNGTVRLSVFLTEHFPFLAYWVYGTKASHVDIFSYPMVN